MIHDLKYFQEATTGHSQPLTINLCSLFLQIQQISSYRLVVSGADNDGAGLSSQCECSIKVKDVNDNFPVLRDSQVNPLVLEEPLYIHLIV